MVHKSYLSKIKIFLFLNGQRGKSLYFFLKKKFKNITVISLNKKILINIKADKKFFFRNINSKSFHLFAKKQKPDLFILGGYPQIVKKKIFDVPKYGTMNLHAGKLPDYRGGSPLNWAIINGEKNFETTIFKIDEGIDTGQVLAKKKSKILSSDTIKTIHKKANNNFNTIIIKAINNLIDKKYLKISKKNAKYWKQRNDKDNYLNLKNKNSVQSHNFVRALTKPYPCAWIMCKNKKVRLVETKIISRNSTLNSPIIPGKVFYFKNFPIVYCSKGTLLIKKYYFEKNKKLKIKNGDILKYYG